MDTRVQRGADVNSDHYLVKTRIRLQLRNRSQKKFKPRLKNEKTRKKYTDAVRSKLIKQ